MLQGDPSEVRLTGGRGDEIVQRYLAARAHTRALFNRILPEAFDARPVPLRHPIRFYEGHLAAFNINTLLQTGLIETDPHPEFSTLFARGIDPVDTQAAASVAIHQWPPREGVAAYLERTDRLVISAMEAARRPTVLLTCIEHEEMHQETLLCLVQHLPDNVKRGPKPSEGGHLPEVTWRTIPGGVVWLGAAPGAPFAWDNELPGRHVRVPGFRLASHKVSNADFLRFVESGGYQDRQLWTHSGWREIPAAGHTTPPLWQRDRSHWLQRGMFATVPLRLDWPAVVSFHEAAAYARWKGARVPTEVEYHLAAYLDGVICAADWVNLEAGDPLDFHSLGLPAIRANQFGVYEMIGNGWEWTSTVFAGLPGFAPMPHYPGYSADFFDGRHYVLKGASPMTQRPLLRPSFRNWYRGSYRYAFTTFRLAK